MEFGASLCDVVSVCGKNEIVAHLSRSRPIDQLKSLMLLTLFDWSRTWSFTNCTSIFDFQISLRYSY